MTPLEILAVKLPDVAEERRLLALAETEQQIKNYCHIDAIPEALYFVLADMTADLLLYELEAERPSAGAGASGSVTAISEGDTSVSFGKSEAQTDRERLLGNHRQMLDKLILDYRQQLQAFRKLRW